MGEGLFFEVIWYLYQGTTDVYHEYWTNASKQCWLQSRVNCPSSTPFPSKPTHIINPWAHGVMSASWISLHWLRPKFVLQCQMNRLRFEFLSKKKKKKQNTSMALSCFWLIQNYRYSKKTKLLLSFLLEIFGMAGWEWARYKLSTMFTAPFAPSCPLPPFCSGADGNRSSLPALRALGNWADPWAWSDPEPGAIHMEIQAQLAQS